MHNGLQIHVAHPNPGSPVPFGADVGRACNDDRLWPWSTKLLPFEYVLPPKAEGSAAVDLLPFTTGNGSLLTAARGIIALVPPFCRGGSCR